MRQNRRNSATPSGEWVAKLRPGRRCDTIAAQIKEMIYSGALKPGERLPSERAFAVQLKVGRPTVREAIQRLEVLGLLEVKGPRGTYVRSLQPESLDGPVKRVVKHEVDMLRQTIDVRMALEGWVAAEAARRATPDDVVRIRQIVEDLERVVERGAAPSELDLAFHLAVVETTRNPVVQQMVEMLISMITSTRAVKNLTHLPGNGRVLIEHHRAVAEAIAKRDPDAAQLAMVTHLKFVSEMLAAVNLS